MKKRLLSVFLALCLTLGLLPGTARAATSGTFGKNNLTWTLDGGTLTVSGNGDMPDYSIWASSPEDPPWYSLRNSIKKVVIKRGITRIGIRSFYDCSNLADVSIANTVAVIDGSAFYKCTSLTGITIPDGVTGFGAGAFAGCSNLKSITLPSSVTIIQGMGVFSNCTSLESVTILGKAKIGQCAFEGCTALKNVSMSNAVSIESSAFGGCTSLTSISIPKSVSSIYSDAFRESSKLSAINVDSNNAYYSSLNGVLFNKNKTKIIYYPENAGASYVIPDGVTDICLGAFYGCSGLTDITIPESVTDIGAYAFSGCSGLTDITIPEGVTSIGFFAFTRCSGLLKIVVPKSVTNISEGAFNGLGNLTIYCYKDSCAHTYAIENNIKYVLLDADPDVPPEEPGEPAPSIQSVILTREGVSVNLLTEPADFAQGSAETAAVNVTVDWDGGEAGRVFLIQDRDTYVELTSPPAAITPGTTFYPSPDRPVYVIATNAAADTLLDWKLTNLRITEPDPPPDDAAVSLSLWDDAGCTREITAMTNTYGSFSWDKDSKDNTDFEKVYLRAVCSENISGLTLTAPRGFSFEPDRMTETKEISPHILGYSCPVYPIYSETQEAELIFTEAVSGAELVIPVNKNSGEGEIYYRDSFDTPGNLALETWHMKNLSLDGFSRPSTQYDHHLAMLSVALSAASYKYDGVRATLRNFGFSNIETHNYRTVKDKKNDQLTLEQNSVASVFATKKYVVDGNIYTIVAVVIRGTLEAEWYSNFDIGSSSTHYGFFLSKQDVLTRLVSYMKKLQDNGLKADQTKMLITGHSRAAAVADLLTVDLNTEYSGKYAGHDDTYTYTFAAPNSTMSVNGRTDNIYNIRNYQDIVAHVPGTFRSPGNNWYVNNPFSDSYSKERSFFDVYFRDEQNGSKGKGFIG